jgi:hypothetical protein
MKKTRLWRVFFVCKATNYLAGAFLAGFLLFFGLEVALFMSILQISRLVSCSAKWLRSDDLIFATANRFNHQAVFITPHHPNG